VYRKTIASCILLLMPLVPSPAAGEETFCEQVASYTMDVRLDTDARMIHGTEVLTWKNMSETATGELWFHLYWNAFQNDKSDFLVEGARRWGAVFRKNKKDDWGYCRVDAIRLLESDGSPGADLLPSLRFRYPDDSNLLDQTVFSVELPRPVHPGEDIRLCIRFHAKVPRPIHRTGVVGDYYFIGQWFPKIGVLYEGKWNCHQFHATSNFFADFGTYDVRITLPSSFILGATGEHREAKDNGDGTTTHRFYQHSVHDFAWTASPRFSEHVEDFVFSPGKSTEITLLLQPYHKHLKDRYLDAVKHALRLCSQWYGDYPYSTITCVDPAHNSRSGGMEYPTLFTGGADFISPRAVLRPEGVTIHEFGHGYFYGLVATNEFEDAWMDEGFTSFLDSEVAYEAYGPPAYSRIYFGIPVVFPEVTIPIESSGISRHRRTYDRDILQRFTWQYLDRESYGANAYAKAELMLRSLKRYLGPRLFAGMIKDYSQRFRFKHPRPADFFRVVSEHAGRDMSWFLDAVVHGSEKLDYAVGEVKSARVRPVRGWVDGEYREGKNSSSTERPYRSEVTVQRRGEVRVPVDVLIRFQDGSETREHWDGQYRWKRFSYESPAPVAAVVVDPDFTWVLDINRTNNSWIRKPNPLAAVKWTSRWLAWLQHALEVFTLFGG